MYNADLDRQQYCDGCCGWYDEECIGLGRKGKKIEGLLGISEMPYVRGYGGHEEVGNWQIVGSGRIKKKAMRLVEEGGKMSGLWKKAAGEKVIMGMIGRRWEMFDFPVCEDVEI